MVLLPAMKKMPMAPNTMPAYRSKLWFTVIPPLSGRIASVQNGLLLHAERRKHIVQLLVLVFQERFELIRVLVVRLPVVCLHFGRPFRRILHFGKRLLPEGLCPLAHFLRPENAAPDQEFGIDALLLHRRHILQIVQPLRRRDRQHFDLAGLHVLVQGRGIGTEHVRIAAQQGGKRLPSSVVGDILDRFGIDPIFVGRKDRDQMIHGAGRRAARYRECGRILLDVVQQGFQILVFGVGRDGDGPIVFGQLRQRRRIRVSVRRIAFLLQVVDQNRRRVDEQLVIVLLVFRCIFGHEHGSAAAGLVLDRNRFRDRLALGQHLGNGPCGHVPSSAGSRRSDQRKRPGRIAGRASAPSIAASCKPQAQDEQRSQDSRCLQQSFIHFKNPFACSIV
ncbi:hypothetical protein BN871_CV_00400 [Paenibacillus sp. P22]|nr:hypothetical protein BN871_CV_00400 [Paenibacillus sp. P22]